jgi:hypothetical protein
MSSAVYLILLLVTQFFCCYSPFNVVETTFFISCVVIIESGSWLDVLLSRKELIVSHINVEIYSAAQCKIYYWMLSTVIPPTCLSVRDLFLSLILKYNYIKIYFLHYKVYPFQLCNSKIFSNFTKCCNYNSKSFLEHFHSSSKISCAHLQLSPFPLFYSDNSDTFYAFIKFLALDN